MAFTVKSDGIKKTVVKELLSERLKKPDVVQLDLTKMCFPEQLAFIQDPHPWVTASCSRRAGKTEVCALDLVDTCLRNNDVICLYITLTRATAERILWRRLLDINDTYKLGGEANISKLSLTFPNKSTIYLSGCKDKSELDKFRGMPLKLVYIDEVQGFRSFINELIDDSLAPALADYAGKLKLIGTPAPLQSGFFWDTLQNPEYSHHRWTFWNNPFIAKKSKMTHEEVLQRELKRRGVLLTHPSVRREWFGEWTVDSDSLVFHYDRTLNDYEFLPELTDYVIGVDIGFVDADAIAVIGWHKNRKECYLVEEFVKPKQGITELVEVIDRMINKYTPLKIVMDAGGLGRKIVQELRQRHSLPIEAAEKTKKNGFIALLNDALRTKNFFASRKSRFAQDSQIVEWDYDKSTPERMLIKDEPHSDICDAVLYAYREALHWLSEPEKSKVDLRTQWLEHSQKLMEEHLEAQIEKQQADEAEQDLMAIRDLSPFEDSNPLQYYLNKKKGQ